MVELEQHGDVTLARLSNSRSRIIGYSVNVFRVRGVVIDTGFPAVEAEVGRLLDEWRPAGIVLTHQHEDHAGNLEYVARRGLPVQAAAATLAAVREPERVGLYRQFCWGRMGPVRSTTTPFQAPGLELVYAPGHSTDHHLVWDAEREVMFGGDLFLGVKVRVARPMEDPRALVVSLRRAAALRPRVFFDSHRGLVPDGAGALLAKAGWLDETIAAVDRRLAEGWSDAAISAEVLGREDAVALVSRGDLCKANFVRALRATWKATG